jgi:hypothetical protein
VEVGGGGGGWRRRLEEEAGIVCFVSMMTNKLRILREITPLAPHEVSWVEVEGGGGGKEERAKPSEEASSRLWLGVRRGTQFDLLPARAPIAQFPFNSRSRSSISIFWHVIKRRGSQKSG